ncbi:hypothetical protein RN001_002677 [Aquatica leii]|uniref:Uncharacterized protein n=1 Tax=Aquatica leii TaxID=1421715 RepID=A0AAN7PMP5_9COLE|nr:hypothetical protein RN001_002677 [Aquatica leii]
MTLHIVTLYVCEQKLARHLKLDFNFMYLEKVNITYETWPKVADAILSVAKERKINLPISTDKSTQALLILPFLFTPGINRLKNEGDVVKVKNFNENKWIDGIVLSKLDQPRSYTVVLSDSRNVIIRNRKHLVLVSKKTCSNKIVDKVLNYEIPHYEESSSNTSKEEQILDNVPNPVHLEPLSRSKSGRTIKAPQKLNL